MVPPTRTMFMPASRIAVSARTIRRRVTGQRDDVRAGPAGAAAEHRHAIDGDGEAAPVGAALHARCCETRSVRGRNACRRGGCATRASAGSPCVCGHHSATPGSFSSPCSTFGPVRWSTAACPSSSATASTSAGRSSTARITTRPSLSITAVCRSIASMAIAPALCSARGSDAVARGWHWRDAQAWHGRVAPGDSGV